MNDDFKLKGDNNPKIKAKYSDEVLKFKQGKKDLKDPDKFESFIRDCEKAVRRDDRYTRYKAHLHESGLDRCAFYSKLTVDKVPIEMHHGPIFTMFDICAIVTDHLLKCDEKVTTMDIADLVLTEHELNHIQVTMLCETAHQAYHSGKIFLHYKQATGDINKFIEKYYKGILKEHMFTFNKYMEMCKVNDATDNDLFITRKRLKDLAKK